ELIRTSPSRTEAEERLIAKGWAPGSVLAMLEKAGGTDACRPDALDPRFGFREGLYYLSEVQAKEILDMRLHRLTGLEHGKLIAEYEEKLALIKELMAILGDSNLLMQVIRDELNAIREQFADERRSEIVASRMDL